MEHFANWIPGFISDGGAVMVVILGCSVFALAVALERAFALRANAAMPRPLLRAIASARGSDESAALLAEGGRFARSPLGHVVSAILEHRRAPRSQNEEAMSAAGREASAMLERGLGWIEVVAVTAPLLGLLGTVLGMVEVFGSFPMRADELPAGIRKALFTTVAGLSVGIPMLAIHIGYSRRVERLAAAMEKHAVMLLNQIYGQEHCGAGVPPAVGESGAGAPPAQGHSGAGAPHEIVAEQPPGAPGPARGAAPPPLSRKGDA